MLQWFSKIYFLAEKMQKYKKICSENVQFSSPNHDFSRKVQSRFFKIAGTRKLLFRGLVVLYLVTIPANNNCVSPHKQAELTLNFLQKMFGVEGLPAMIFEKV